VRRIEPVAAATAAATTAAGSERFGRFAAACGHDERPAAAASSPALGSDEDQLRADLRWRCEMLNWPAAAAAPDAIDEIRAVRRP